MVFSGYVEHLPAAGEIVLLTAPGTTVRESSASWAFAQALISSIPAAGPIFERLLIDDGILLRKYWFSVSDLEQEWRFKSLQRDPMRRRKLSEMDLQSISKWVCYSRAKDEMFVQTGITGAPWYVVESDDKRRSRINVISHLLSTINYEYHQPPTVSIPARPPIGDYIRPPREEYPVVPDLAGGRDWWVWARILPSFHHFDGHRAGTRSLLVIILTKRPAVSTTRCLFR